MISVLYYGCRPTRPTVERLVDVADIVEEVTQAEPEMEAVGDWKLIPYGKGPGLLAKAVRNAIAMDPAYEGQALYLNPREWYSDVLYPELKAISVQVITPG